MAVKIRLSRTGRKKTPHYRIVVADERQKRDGRVIENIGQYQPRSEKPVTLKTDRVEYWLSKGAKPTQTVAQILKKAARSA